MRLWLVRHAQPLAAPGLCYGQLDLPADAVRSDQAARALRQALKGVAISVLRCSPLSRTRLLARALAPDLGVPVQEDARLAEMNFGQWEGVPWTQISKACIDAWTADFAHHRVGGGESTQQVLERVWSALEEDRQVAGDVLWVTHAGVIRAVLHLRARGAPRIAHAREWPEQAPAWGQWLVLDLPERPIRS